jgi:hypothetical protein
MQFFKLVSLLSPTYFTAVEGAPSPLPIEFSVDVKDASAINQDICLRVCLPDTPTCPDGWVSKPCFC